GLSPALRRGRDCDHWCPGRRLVARGRGSGYTASDRTPRERCRRGRERDGRGRGCGTATPGTSVVDGLLVPEPGAGEVSVPAHHPDRDLLDRHAVRGGGPVLGGDGELGQTAEAVGVVVARRPARDVELR